MVLAAVQTLLGVGIHGVEGLDGVERFEEGTLASVEAGEVGIGVDGPVGGAIVLAVDVSWPPQPVEDWMELGPVGMNVW